MKINSIQNTFALQNKNSVKKQHSKDTNDYLSNYDSDRLKNLYQEKDQQQTQLFDHQLIFSYEVSK
ncbi:hypothetical protein, partial [Poseidonibacter sp.]|uniref:hypothetical protein n=1 Tax=Poseidonibacter sp. TaxID=2321188 RepID=UPI003C7729A9